MALGLLAYLVYLTFAVGGTEAASAELPHGTDPAQPVEAARVHRQEGVQDLLTRRLADGEAFVWYLGHCGWAVKTRARLLIFDYWEQQAGNGERSLAAGRVNPTELQELDVYVFVSHSHGDHYSPAILDWAATIPKVTYVFGWEAGLDRDIVQMSQDREVRTFGDMEVSTVNHQFDGIPEVAYLVKVDGLVIYHSGDHASTAEIPNATFTGNIDYLAGRQPHVDLAFISTFGRRGGIVVNDGDLYTIAQLRPRAAFPMHHGGGEDLNQRFVDEVAPRLRPTGVFAARRLGDRFFYADGRVRSTPQ